MLRESRFAETTLPVLTSLDRNAKGKLVSQVNLERHEHTNIDLARHATALANLCHIVLDVCSFDSSEKIADPFLIPFPILLQIRISFPSHPSQFWCILPHY